jgi:hypothetical protein
LFNVRCTVFWGDFFLVYKYHIIWSVPNLDKERC